MNNAITFRTNSFKFNYIYWLLLAIALIAALLIFSTVFRAKHIAEAKYNYDDIAGLAEEIYDAGTITDAVKNLPLDAALITKMNAEIEKQLAKTADYPNCEVYFLHTRQSAHYPVLGYGNTIVDYEYMRTGDIWKVGMTKNKESGRYSSDTFYKNPKEGINLTRANLNYQQVYTGTYKQCIIFEKLLIYTYSLWSEHSNLLKPPGCKIYR